MPYPFSHQISVLVDFLTSSREPLTLEVAFELMAIFKSKLAFPTCFVILPHAFKDSSVLDHSALSVPLPVLQIALIHTSATKEPAEPSTVVIYKLTLIHQRSIVLDPEFDANSLKFIVEDLTRSNYRVKV